MAAIEGGTLILVCGIPMFWSRRGQDPSRRRFQRKGRLIVAEYMFLLQIVSDMLKRREVGLVSVYCAPGADRINAIFDDGSSSIVRLYRLCSHQSSTESS
jgi:hypothetical protein